MTVNIIGVAGSGMHKIYLASVRSVLRLCASDSLYFGEQLPLKRKIAPVFSGDIGRVAWGLQCD